MSETRPDPTEPGRPERAGGPDVPSAGQGPSSAGVGEPPTGPLWLGVDTPLYGAPHTGQGAPGPAFTMPEAPPAAPAPRRRGPRRATTALLALGLVGLLVVAGGAGIMLLGGIGLQSTEQRASSRAAGEQRWPAGPPPVTQTDGSAPDWVATAAAVAPSVVAITVATSGARGGEQGSGVVLDKEGHIVTNHHVVASGIGGGATILVTLNDKRAYQATIVGTDASTDLAVLQLDGPDDLTPITMGNDTQLKVGSPVMAVGNPLGLAGTVTTGIVSALNRPVTTQQASGDSTFGGGGEYVVTNAIQTSAAINPGNSGGALVNASGQLVGINSSIAQTAQDGGNIGIGFAIPVNEARSVSAQILRTGSVRHPYLGVTGRGGYVRDGKAQRAAAIIGSVTADSPAARAGLGEGDAIVAIDDEPVDSWESLVAQVRERDVDAQVKVTLVRGGSRQDVIVTLAQRPSSMN